MLLRRMGRGDQAVPLEAGRLELWHSIRESRHKSLFSMVAEVGVEPTRRVNFARF
jgi:hypothetical protein